MVYLFTLLLGVTLASRGCLDGENAVPFATQAQDLVDALAPFTETAPAPGLGGEDDVAVGYLSPSHTAPTTSECRLTGLNRNWPHENAEPESELESGRRLLRWSRRHGHHSKVAFDVTSGVVSPLVLKKRNRQHECFSDGSVSFSVQNVEFTADSESNDVLVDPRRQLDNNCPFGTYGPYEGKCYCANGNVYTGVGSCLPNDEPESDAVESETTTPSAVVTLTQTNAFEDDDGQVVPVTFEITLSCRPMYNTENDACVAIGVSCSSGEYTYFFEDSSEDVQQSRSLDNVGMKCSHVADFFDQVPDCDWDN